MPRLSPMTGRSPNRQPDLGTLSIWSERASRELPGADHRLFDAGKACRRTNAFPASTEVENDDENDGQQGAKHIPGFGLGWISPSATALTRPEKLPLQHPKPGGGPGCFYTSHSGAAGTYPGLRGGTGLPARTEPRPECRPTTG